MKSQQHPQKQDELTINNSNKQQQFCEIDLLKLKIIQKIKE